MPSLRFDILVDNKGGKVALQQFANETDAAFKKSAAAVSKVSLQALPEHERAVLKVKRQYEGLQEQINKLSSSNRISQEMANQWHNSLGVRMNEDIKNLDKTSSQTFSSITGYARIAATSIAGLAVGKVFMDGLKSVENYRLEVASLSAFITTFSEKSAHGDLAGGFKDAYAYAQRLVPELERIDAKTIASGKDLTVMAETMMQNGVLLDVDNQKQVQGFVNIANALKLVTAGQNQDIQMRQEINALLMGQIRQTDRLPKLLANIDPQLQDHLKLWKQQGTTIEHVGELLKGFNASSGLVEDTWATVGSSLETVRDKVLRDGFKPVFEDIVGLSKEFKNSLMDSEGKLTPLALDIQKDIREAYGLLKETVEIAEHFAPPIIAVVTALGAAKVAQLAFNAATKANPYILGATVLYGVVDWLSDYTEHIRVATAETEKLRRVNALVYLPPDHEVNKTRLAASHGGMPKGDIHSKNQFQQALAIEHLGLEQHLSSSHAAVEVADKALAPKLSPPPPSEDDIKAAQRYAEALATAKREWGQKADLEGLTGVDKELQAIGQQADELRAKFKRGSQAWIDDGQAMRENAAIQADYIKRVTKAQEEWDKTAIYGLTGQEQALAKVRAEFDGYRQTLVESAATLGEPMQEVYDRLDALDRAEGKALQDIRDKGDDTAKALEHAFDGWANGVSSDINDMVWGADASFGKMGESFARMITQMIIQTQIMKPIMDDLTGGDSGSGGWIGAIGSWVGSLFANTYHTGGVVGETAVPSRSVSPSLFANAPRFHAGLASDEFPAILQRGETVIPRGGSMATAPPQVVVQVVNQTSQPVDAKNQEPKFDGERWVIGVILKDVQQGGQLRGLFAGAAA